MKTITFNTQILDALACCSFHYYYSKTIAEARAAGTTSIYLTPVYFKPNIWQLPLQCDTYIYFADEPTQMATGIDQDTNVYINLDDTLLKKCYGKRILMIDDDVDVLDIMEKVLIYEGF